MIEFSKVKQAFIKHMCEDVNNDKTIGKVVFKLLVFPTTKKHLAGCWEYQVDSESTDSSGLIDAITTIAEKISEVADGNRWDLTVTNIDGQCNIICDIFNSIHDTRPTNFVHVAVNCNGEPVNPNRTMRMCAFFNVYTILDREFGESHETYDVLIYI